MMVCPVELLKENMKIAPKAFSTAASEAPGPSVQRAGSDEHLIMSCRHFGVASLTTTARTVRAQDSHCSNSSLQMTSDESNSTSSCTVACLANNDSAATPAIGDARSIPVAVGLKHLVVSARSPLSWKLRLRPPPAPSTRVNLFRALGCVKLNFPLPLTLPNNPRPIDQDDRPHLLHPLLPSTTPRANRGRFLGPVLKGVSPFLLSCFRCRRLYNGSCLLFAVILREKIKHFISTRRAAFVSAPPIVRFIIVHKTHSFCKHCPFSL
jgi:hypothetical protein